MSDISYRDRGRDGERSPLPDVPCTYCGARGWCGHHGRIQHTHSDRIASAQQRCAFADEAGALAPELKRIADKYGYQPSTVAKIAVARARA